MYPFVNTYMLLVTILCSSFMVSHEMLLDPAVGKYIQDVLNEFSNNPTSNTFDNILLIRSYVETIRECTFCQRYSSGAQLRIII